MSPGAFPTRAWHLRIQHRMAIGAVYLAGLVAQSPPLRAQTNDLRWDVFPRGQLLDQAGVIPNNPVVLKSLVDASQLLHRHRPPATAPAWSERRATVEREFRKALGLESLPERTPLRARTTTHHEFDGFTVDDVVFESRPGFPVTANVYRPRATTPGVRHPAVLSPIGHFLTPGKTAPDVQARCIGLVRRGYVVLAYDAIGQGERMSMENVHHDAGYALLPLGQTIAGWMVWDSMRAVDYLETLDDVDPSNIGITGNSGGGLNSLFTAALEPRIKAAVVVGFTFEFDNWLKYGGPHCTCTHLPGIFGQMEWFEIAGLIAPRAVMMIQGGNDGIFPIQGARRSGDDVAATYQVLGVADRARFVELPGLPHAYSQPYRETMYGWMDRHLKGVGDGGPAVESDVEPLPERDPRLLCDPERAFMPASKTVLQIAREAALKQVLDNSRARDPIAVSNWVRGLVLGASAESRKSFQAPRVAPGGTVRGGALEKWSFLSEDGERLPALFWRSATATNGAAPLVVVADSKGKAAVADTELPETLLQVGCNVLAVDLRGRGETLGRYGPRYDTNFRLVANQVLSGQPLAGRRAFDLVRAIDLLESRREPGLDHLVVAGIGDDALPVLLAAIVDARIRRVVLSNTEHSFVSRMIARPAPPAERFGDAWNDPQLDGRVRNSDRMENDFGSVIPGILGVADIPDLLAALGNRPVLFCAASDQRTLEAFPLAGRFRSVTAAAGLTGLQYLPTEPLNAKMLQNP